MRGKLLLLPFLMFLLYLAYYRTIAQDTITWNSWSFSEWLFSYSAGFTRRGLPGEISRIFSNGNDIRFINQMLFIIQVTVIALYFLLLALQRSITLLVAVVGLFLPGSPLHALATTRDFHRKESIFLFPILISGITIVWLDRNSNKNVLSLLGAISLLLSSLLAAVATLSHEAFFLMGLPSCILLWNCGLHRFHFTNTTRYLFLLFLSVPTIVSTAFSAIYQSSESHAQEMWSALSNASKIIIMDGNPIPIEPVKAMASWGHQFWYYAYYKTITNLTSDLLYLWCAIILFVVINGVLFLKLTNASAENKNRLRSIGLIVGVLSLPITIISDPGRWISYTALNIFILWLSLLHVNATTSQPAAVTPISKRKIILFIVTANLFFTIPSMIITGHIHRKGNLLTGIYRVLASNN